MGIVALRLLSGATDNKVGLRTWNSIKLVTHIDVSQQLKFLYLYSGVSFLQFRKKCMVLFYIIL